MLHPATPGFLPSNLSHSPTLKMAICFSFIVTYTLTHPYTHTHICTHIHTQTTCQVHLIFSVYICGCGCTANKLHWRRLTQRAKLPEDIRRLHLLATGATPKTYLYYSSCFYGSKNIQEKKGRNILEVKISENLLRSSLFSKCMHKQDWNNSKINVRFHVGGPTPRHIVLQSTKN